MNAKIVAVVFTALTACSYSATYPPVTTTSAKIEARRRESVPPSPPPSMGQMPNSATPLPELSETTTIPDRASPPPGMSVTETVTPTAEKRDRRIESKLRAAIAADAMLSPEAKQVEVIVKDRKIILKGQAHSEQERMDIDNKARATDDVIEVDDQIQLVP